uniref:Uncharacterized protein n=1 Tax=Ciona intestinalis TaxID=7719 RepID=H2XY90_CIOIN
MSADDEEGVGLTVLRRGLGLGVCSGVNVGFIWRGVVGELGVRWLGVYGCKMEHGRNPWLAGYQRTSVGYSPWGP